MNEFYHESETVKESDYFVDIKISDDVTIKIHKLSGIVDIFSEESKDLVEIDGDDNYKGGITIGSDEIYEIYEWLMVIANRGH